MTISTSAQSQLQCAESGVRPRCCCCSASCEISDQLPETSVTNVTDLITSQCELNEALCFNLSVCLSSSSPSKSAAIQTNRLSEQSVCCPLRAHGRKARANVNRLTDEDEKNQLDA